MACARCSSSSGRKTKRRRPTSSKTNGGLIRSVIAIIHNYSTYSLNCTHRRSHTNNILSWLACPLLCFVHFSLFLSLCCLHRFLSCEFSNSLTVACGHREQSNAFYHRDYTRATACIHFDMSTDFNWYCQRIFHRN